MTTDVRLSADGELLDASIYPARIPIMRRLDYDLVDRFSNRARLPTTPPRPSHG